MNRRLLFVIALALVLLSPALALRAQPARLTGQLLLNATALKPGQPAALAIVFDIAPGFHAQSHTPLDQFAIPFEIAIAPVSGVTFSAPLYPPGVIHDYPALGKISVYEKHTIVYVPVQVAPDAKPGAVELKATLSYQICDDKACYAPAETTVSLKTEIVAPEVEVKPANEAAFKGYSSASTRPTTGPSRATPAADGNAPPPFKYEAGGPKYTAAGWFGVAFLVGIIFNIMPCVLPVLPLKIMGFQEAAQHHRTKTVMLSLVFSLGIICVFLVLALFVVVLKTIAWGQQFSNPWFAWGIVALMFFLSLGMFGGFAVNLPVSVYSITPRHDTYGGNFAWGVLAAILSTPCTAPLLPFLMLWATTVPTYIGVPAIGMVGVGMGFPYVLLSFFPEAARKFPRTGPWAELVKQTMGFLLLGSAVYFAAGRLIEPPAHWWAVVPVALVASLYIMARTIQLTREARPVVFASIIATAMTCTTLGIAAHFNGLLSSEGAGGSTVTIPWQPYSDQALKEARASGNIVLIKFTATWCLNCQYVDGTVFHDPRTYDLIQKHHIIALKADLTSDTAPGWPRLRELNSTGGIPLTAIYAPGSDTPIQLGGVYTTDTLIQAVQSLDRTALARR